MAQVSEKALTQALVNQVAGFFSSKDEVVTDAGKKVLVETNSFLMENILNGICWKVSKMQEAQEQYHGERRRILLAYRRQHDGTEISLEKIRRAGDALRRAEENLVFIEAALGAAKKAYLEVAGREYGTRRDAGLNIPADPELADIDAMLAADRKLTSSYRKANGKTAA
jgi:hypothetical protein